MSALSELDALILREAVHPPLITKNAELTFAEWDAHVTAMYDAIQSMVSGDNVTPYNPLTVYDAASTDVYLKFAGYDSRIWEAIGTFSDVTPTEGINWTQITLAQLFPDLIKLAQVSAGETGCICIKEVKLEIPTASVLTLNSVPIELIAAPGAGFAVELISVSMKMVFNSVAYATNTKLRIITTGATQEQVEFHTAVLSSASSTFNGISKASQSGTNLIENAAVNATVDVGDPTAGDSDITIYATYRIITL